MQQLPCTIGLFVRSFRSLSCRIYSFEAETTCSQGEVIEEGSEELFLSDKAQMSIG